MPAFPEGWWERPAGHLTVESIPWNRTLGPEDIQGLSLTSSPLWEAIQRQTWAILQDAQVLLTSTVRLPMQH